MIATNQYRTHACGEIGKQLIGSEVRVAGWVENIRDHGGIQFLDLRDQSGIVQIVAKDEEMLQNVNRECTVTVRGTVVARDPDTVNDRLSTGRLEIRASQLEVLGRCRAALPFEISAARETREETRLRYRYLDLRNRRNHENLVLRSKIISHLRAQMEKLGFLEVQTPILTASSPEGARDYLIPSRKHPGKFYALPQAPQIFKQLLMVSGIERYYQIAPCFRDEDARADRSPGEFYQLDFEMAFATEEDVFAVAEQVLYETFRAFTDRPVSRPPFERISYRDCMLRYGTDKPDLRCPLTILDLSDRFVESGFAPFRGQCVRAIVAPGAAAQARSFFEGMLEFAVSIGMKGLGYLKVRKDGGFDGPIDKFLSEDDRVEITKRAALKPGDVLFFIADSEQAAPRLAGQIRRELGARLGLIDEDRFVFCFVTDFPMYEPDELTGRPAFTHNPFSMPKGGLQALESQDPFTILAHQYDIVCNGIELSSGAVRNHDLDTMVRAFEIAGYDARTVEEKFRSLYTAFQYGAPPHAGMAPGVDRMVMLLTGEQNIREVIAFPLNANAQDAMMGAPCEVSPKQLREVHIRTL
ncbi:aspartate--tRNA ligase [Feifania hominis]|uniref:Aspartate--tRNA(Asp/Asn) ligase n=1 Tax=Feifania hominis TaxID=2763660 RepID=A0A926HTT6_9FIRM|nr:aspartate--tRNA ligase [Feifania hominis]MBC8536194.1 aspartate--tRNA ligase [Feifania hominis]